MLTAAELKVCLRAHDLRLTKRLGQHHLVDPGVIDRLMRRITITSDQTVVEIGAGLGALTEPLAQKARRVLAVEIDRRICGLLRERVAALEHVSVICGDILAFSWEEYRGVSVVGAIPYHITSPLLVALSAARRVVREAWIILQQEVAQRLTAKPRTKPYGRLSILGQYSWTITPVMTIPPRAFFPQPDVDSVCLYLLPHERPPVSVMDEATFFDVVKAAFGHRRKTLVNCLSAHGTPLVSRARAQTLVRQLGLPASVRGEALSLEQFAELANALSV
jgi:16S rRNA (adenine1518-N6/adenine1519-N6)-dimethyltransferase